MIEHEGKQLDDYEIRPFSLAQRIAHNFKYNLCEIFVIYGMPEGIGKSSHANYSLADINGWYNDNDWEHKKWMWESIDKRPKDTPIWELDWEMSKNLIKYPPDHVVDMCMDMVDHEKRLPFFHWDDAGIWLNAMDWHDPFVTSFMKYISIARTNWGGIVLSTPVEDWVLKKLRTATGVIHVVISTAPHCNEAMTFRPKVAKGYKIQRYVGRIRPYWNTVYEDYFPAIMPDSFYRWYKPLRDKYAKAAVQMMRFAIDKKKQSKRLGDKFIASMDEGILEEIEKHIHEANSKAKELTEATEQIEPQPSHH